jgi:hypothetical protein
MDPVILIAFVNESRRETYGLFFAEQGYRVLTASTVLECLHKVRWQAPEVLVLDEELWGGEEGLLAISGEDILWPSVVLLTPEPSDWRDDFDSPPVVASIERPVNLGDLLENVATARRVFFYTGGSEARESLTPSSVWLPSAI